MTEKQPLREIILLKSSELFRDKGYTATSIRQIAKAAGCKSASLYYHFEGGKSDILREVIYNTIEDPSSMLDSTDEAKNLEEFLLKLSQTLAKELPRVTDRLTWLTLEFSSLPENEQNLLREHLLKIHEIFQQGINRFVKNRSKASELGWIIFCAFFGYQHIFSKMGIKDLVKLENRRFGKTLTQIVSKGSS